jgi:glycosyltransferase involved in cell wall biosynthesis
VEALACGTPVIAFNRGSMSELIVEGVTGSVVTDVDSAAEAAKRRAEFDRRAVRASVVQRFGADRMVDAYVAACRRVLAESHRRPSCEPAAV